MMLDQSINSVEWVIQFKGWNSYNGPNSSQFNFFIKCWQNVNQEVRKEYLKIYLTLFMPDEITFLQKSDGADGNL